MLLPKHILNKISYFEHSVHYNSTRYYDVFKIHFKGWWRFRKKIVISRHYNKQSKSAAELYNQLNGWVYSNLHPITKKYEVDNESNIIHLKIQKKDNNIDNYE